MEPKKLSAYLYEYKLPYLFAILSIAISVSLDLISPQLTKRIIDEVIIGGETGKLKYFLAGILGDRSWPLYFPICQRIYFRLYRYKNNCQYTPPLV